MKVAAIVWDTVRELLYRKTLVVYVGMVTLTHLVFALVMSSGAAEGFLSGLRMTPGGPPAPGGTYGDPGLEAFVRTLQLVVAATLYSSGILLSVFATASLVPRMLEKGYIDLLLSKPVARPVLLLSRYLGGLLVATATLLYLVLGLAGILALRTGVWNGGLVLSGLVMALCFASLLGFLVLAGVILRSTTASLMLIAGLFVAGLILRPLHAALAGPLADGGGAGRLAARAVVEALYHALPRTSDFGGAVSALILGRGEIAWGPMLGSTASGAAALALAILWFSRQDY